jgi:hypothetical protein
MHEPELNSFETEIAVENLKRCKSPGVDQIPPDFYPRKWQNIKS